VNVGSLFTGIGGFDLGLERAGMRVVWQCEQDEYCRRVLARHWPGVPCHPDVRAVVADTARVPEGGIRAAAGTNGQRTRAGDQPSGERRPLPVPVPYVDVLCGGFPCQDLSYAGKGAGLDGARSGLWAEYARLVRELRPRYVIVENVPALLARGMERVLGDLAAIGYDAEWDCIPASAVGAPHRRDRVWLVAYPNADGGGREVSGEQDGRAERSGLEASQRHDVDGLHADVAYPDGAGLEGHRGPDPRPGELASTPRSGQDRTGDVADAESERVGAGLRADGAAGQRRGRLGDGGGENGGRWLTEPDVRGVAPGLPEGLDGAWAGGEWPGVPRVAVGIPNRVDRLRSLGNALVPQIAEWIGWRILEHERR
jgi:DNA (cytosine-5)-methyltransferase 1